jgi:hypothetical protein
MEKLEMQDLEIGLTRMTTLEMQELDGGLITGMSNFASMIGIAEGVGKFVYGEIMDFGSGVYAGFSSWLD